MGSQRRKLVLIHPPFTMPCSAPMGVAMLKGFIERNLDNWEVRTIDLNARLFAQMEKMLSDGQLHDNRLFTHGVVSEIALSRGFEVLRGEHGQEFFQRHDRYTLYANLFRGLVMRELVAAPTLKLAFDKGPPLPDLLGNMVTQALDDGADAVGISVNYDAQIWPALCLAMEVKSRRQIPIVFGGSAFCVNTDRLMSQHHDLVDFIICGEGEIPLAKLLENDFNATDVAGATWWDGQVRSNEATVEKEIDRFGAPDFSQLDSHDYFSPLPVLPVVTSRGCYWRRCAFCVHYRSAGMSYRCRSIPSVIEELRGQAQRGVRHFQFIDEMISPAQFGRLAEGIIEAKLPIAYYAMAKPTAHFDEALLGKMRQSGCRFILWGLESGSQRLLDLMDKGTRIEQVSGVLQASAKAGIINHVFVLFGFPTETRQEFNMTLQFLHDNRNAIMATHNGIFSLEEDSPVFDDPQRFGVTSIRPAGDYRSGARYTYNCSAGMSHADIVAAFQRNTPFLSSFSPISSALANIREHALLIYDRMGHHLDLSARRVAAFQPV